MLDEQVLNAVATGNLKAISEQPAMLSNLAYSNVVSTNNLGQQNAVSNQQAGNQLGVPLVAKAANTISNTGPLAARSAVDVLSNNELAQTIADLKSAVDAFAAPHGGHWLKRLAGFGLRISPKGELLILPPGATFLIPEGIRHEDVRVTVNDGRITIRVSERA